ncbi:MAG: peptide ABC transporter substrate-binding protein [Rhodospirillaceae bacterium]|nr:peptide ABC transporter substrate-binding protein [Rhodospirillaceae bacterium]
MARIGLFLAAWLALSNAASAEQVFRRGNIGEPDSLDPHMTTSGYAGNVIFEMFVGLTTVDPQVNVIPGAAESWAISPDGKTYTFKIRPGMTWSDGRPVTADDFAYAFRRTMDPATASRAAPLLYMIANAREVNVGALPVDQLGVRAVDAATFEVRLNHPTPYFLELIVHRCFPVPRWAVEAHGRNWTKPENIVVNGAFKLAEWSPNSRIVLTKNPAFYDAGNVALDRVEYYVAEDQGSAFKRYRADELDTIANFPPAQLDWIRENLPQDLRLSQNLGLLYYTFNTRRPPFDDPRVRNALAMVLDRQLMTDRIMRGGEMPADSLVPPLARQGYAPAPSPWAGMSMADRVARAKALLAEAGFGPENPLRFEFRYNTDEIQKRVALAAAAAWKQIGAEAELLNTDLNNLNATLRNGDYQVARYQWFAEYRDPTSFLYLLESDAVGDNHSKYGNPAYDALMRQVYAELDPVKRNALMREAEAIVLRDVPITPINYYVSKRLVKPFIAGFDDNPRGINIARWVKIARP